MLKDKNVFYYDPLIPTVKSTTRYNHALAISNLAETVSLITHQSPPSNIKDRFDSVYILKDVESSTDIFRNARDAKNIVHRNSQEPLLITSFHYAPILAGYLIKGLWFADVYDDPYQQVIHGPTYSMHQVGIRVAVHLLGKADTAIHVLHPAIPRLFGKERKYVMNGAPTSLFASPEKPQRVPLRCVWVGKTDIRFGIRNMIEALEHTTQQVHVDVFGEPYDDAEKLSTRINHRGTIEFHGNVDHQSILEAIEKAHVGFCLLPPTTDFEYAYPIKIGEYLAGGAVPIATGFPGIRQMCKEAGRYPCLEPKAIATELNEIATLPRDEFEDLVKLARNNAELIAWERERQWFARQVLDSVKDVHAKQN